MDGEDHSDQPESTENSRDLKPPHLRVRRLTQILSFDGTLGSMESAGGRIGLPKPDEAEGVAARLLKAAATDEMTFGSLRSLSQDRLASDIARGSQAMRDHGAEASLSPGQIASLEAIILLVGRPALFIRNDKVDVPSGEWGILQSHVADIATIAGSVGRISATPSYGRPFEGTGFVVGPGLVMTNRHVVEAFTEWTAAKATMVPGRSLRIDFKQEFGSNARLEFPIIGVRWVDARQDIDLAILELGKGAPGTQWPTALRLQKSEGFVAESNTIFVIGFPAADPERNDPGEMERIFEVYEKKRLSPGRIMTYAPGGLHLLHDCSTLGGNSGSCVVDFSTKTVIGLHFEGDYLKANKAVVLPTLASEEPFADLRWHEGRVT